MNSTLFCGLGHGELRRAMSAPEFVVSTDFLQRGVY
jgi:hypothetical protein